MFKHGQLASARAFLPFACRSAHTRAKKVNVQLLRDGYKRRFAGEVFQVSEGHMRLKLHPEGLAAYVLPNEATPLPVLPAAEAQRRRREAQQALKLAAAQAEEEARAARSTQQSTGTAEKEKVQSLIDALDFPTFSSSTSAPSETISNAAAQEGSTSTAPKETAAQDVNSKDSKPKKFAWQSDLVARLTEDSK